MDGRTVPDHAGPAQCALMYPDVVRENLDGQGVRLTRTSVVVHTNRMPQPTDILGIAALRTRTGCRRRSIRTQTDRPEGRGRHCND